ncbi:MAG: Ni,Fe-hydrogenase III large subunit [Gammaproteobacteria bacterium CG22_combo_CG10-13_8_21_14_all_40_8]|nr:MAG: Ni,Fe-hydrogenase III large subunit [Gammaproteobacteria bacterium CG22_combo_CG10-13_8_21_14_all_40_8]
MTLHTSNPNNPVQAATIWTQPIAENLQKLGIKSDFQPHSQWISRLSLNRSDWLTVAEVLRSLEARFSALWADEFPEYAEVLCLYFVENHYLLVTTKICTPELHLASITTVFPAANRMERHTQDLLGIAFNDSPDDRRWTRHRAWKEKEYPLRQHFPLQPEAQKPTPADSHYPFFQTQGSAVYEIPVGPIHAGIIEPGHFRFQAVGETILNIEERLGYTHKGIEKLAVGRSPQDLLKLAARVSGDSSVAHSWAAAKALESQLNIQVDNKVHLLRALICERERIANHVGDIGAICNDVGFTFPHQQCARMRELWQRQQNLVFGHRLLMDCITLGDVSFSLEDAQLNKLQNEAFDFKKDFSQLIQIIQDYPSLEDRLANTGTLPPITAKQLGCLGYVAKASRFYVDVRIDTPYPPYHMFCPDKIRHKTGDVMSRLQVRVDEVRDSLRLIEEILNCLKSDTAPCAISGDQAADLIEEKASHQSSHSKTSSNIGSIGLVEAWRGELICYIRLDADGKVCRYFPRDPSWLNWPALEALLDGNIVPDFPVCNKSVNASYSGVDL